MKLAHIVPTNYLSLNNGRPIQMALAHLMGDQVYRDFYINSSGLLLLDNGLYENSQVTEDYLLNLLQEVFTYRSTQARPPVGSLMGPDLEIVAPDTLYDGPSTVARSTDFVNKIRAKLSYDDFAKLRIMFVPQGSNSAEWTQCLKDLISLTSTLMPPGNATIALSKLSCPRSFKAETGSPYVSINRLAAYLILKRYWSGPIHLLGAGVPQEWQFYTADGAVRSCDTSLAFQMGTRGISDPELAFPSLGAPGMDTHLDFNLAFSPLLKTLTDSIASTLDTKYV
jgi:hypothetical protein